MARILAGDGWDLIIVGRNTDALDKLRNELASGDNKVIAIQSDLSKDGAAEALFNDVKTFGIDVDFLINNAGFGDLGMFAECDLSW